MQAFDRYNWVYIVFNEYRLVQISDCNNLISATPFKNINRKGCKVICITNLPSPEKLLLQIYVVDICNICEKLRRF